MFLGGVGYFLIVQRLSRPSSPVVEQKNAPTEQPTTQFTQEASFNTNDNLDEALQDLDQLDQF